jgi:hypothetical protein
MTRLARNRSTLPAPWTAQNAAHRALENADAFSTSFNRYEDGKDLQNGGRRK